MGAVRIPAEEAAKRVKQIARLPVDNVTDEDNRDNITEKEVMAYGTAIMDAKPDEITEIEPLEPYSALVAFAVTPHPWRPVVIDCGDGEVFVEILGLFKTLVGAKEEIIRHFREAAVNSDARLLWFRDSDREWTAQPEKRYTEDGPWHKTGSWYGIRQLRLWP